jgi:hypothetical protein
MAGVSSASAESRIRRPVKKFQRLKAGQQHRKGGGKLMAKPVRTPEFHQFCRTLKCPNGHKRSVRFIEGAGDVLRDLSMRDRVLLENPTTRLESHSDSMRRIGWLRAMNHDLFGGVAIERFRTDSEIECALCSMRWLAFVQEGSQYQIIAEHGLPRRVTTPIGTDTRRLDRRGSIVDSTATIHLEQTWIERLECVWERTTNRSHSIKASAKGNVGAASLSSEVQSGIQRSLRQTLTRSTEVQHKFSQSIDVPIPAGRLAIVDITWKQVWEESDCEVRLGENQSVIVSFRRAVDLMFDDAVRHE